MINGRFTNAQLELLKIFSTNLSDERMKELKRILVEFSAKIVMDEADKVYEEENWTDETIQELLNTKLRRRT